MLNNSYHPKTSDGIIRKALIRKLLQEHPNEPDTIVVEELGLQHGTVRVDVALVNGRLHGFELKSDLDTLLRLPRQMQTYNMVLDQITLVVGKDHLHKAVNLIPDWWGVIIAKSIDTDGNVRFYEIREPENNPTLDSMSIVRLLWKDEALSILENLGHVSGIRYKRRDVIYEKLVSVLSQDELKAKVRKSLSTRINWRVAR
ncbi:MAG: hypothetical protein UV73_C0003G0207 [Candidatus Gottesmanbacteria bacterium GW2011_GWA2_43_14]|uniref:Sce7726 family protein n=1 Tax=Candidatus Gottesmanbacteria bacterium GW2011_GWA2_43_14 TaxID=1618443 RepID=A0A0G1DK90_9BACT|nr:MAG: hypothetical protein UV73_C0003G0207 [Candidatus Gottesmanbacteria bacterium GW2011_GWA2_43_14]